MQTEVDSASSEDEEVEQARPALRALALRWLLLLPAVTLLIGLAVTAALALLTHGVYDRSQNRLLHLRLRDAASVIGASVDTVETPLASALPFAVRSPNDLKDFSVLAGQFVGPGRQFVTLSLWRISRVSKGPLVTIGAAPELRGTPQQRLAQITAGAARHKLSVINLLSAPQPRIGYGYALDGDGAGYAVSAEAAVPARHVTPAIRDSPFADLHYSLYLGQRRPADLLITDTRQHPLQGSRVSERVPFGDTSFLLTMAADHSLEGSLPPELPWIIAGVGPVISLLAAAGVLTLSRRRWEAERLAQALEVTARENERLYAQQRTIAQTLQHALLPDRLPDVPGVQVTAHYQPGERSVDVGGDWYDVIALPDRSLLLVIGDVSGRGLRAATTMAGLRYAIRAYAAQGDPPESILSRLSSLLSVLDQGQLATVLCLRIDIGARTISATSAGHLPPLILSAAGAVYLTPPIGVPVGVDRSPRYESATMVAPPHATLLAFTDGLVERRGESLDAGLQRLARAANGGTAPFDHLLGNLVTDLSDGSAMDDIAIVGLRWTN